MDTFILRLTTALLCLIALPSCMTGGGRYQKNMCEGKQLYDTPVHQWQASDNAYVPYCQWLPSSGTAAKAVIIAVPGVDASSNEWEPLGKYFAARDFEVYASDLRGQGKDFDSPKRGNFSDWNRWVSDVQEFTKQSVHGRKLPVFYVGQSLGSMVAFAAAYSAPPGSEPTGLVLEAPAFVFSYAPAIANPVLAIGELLTLNCGRITTPAALEFAKANITSNDPDECHWERSTDRVCKGFTFQYFSACFRLGDHDRDLVAKFDKPVLIQYGCSDPTWPLAKYCPCQILAMLGSKDKRLWWHPNHKASHDMLTDSITRSALLKNTESWLNDHLRTH